MVLLYTITFAKNIMIAAIMANLKNQFFSDTLIAVAMLAFFGFRT
jgi:nitrate/nitrite transporter NarK